ncbi:S1 family peptidase [Actinomadura fulvescens]|uniref:S1 family peptidase n=1 Tax=Actinomadura fulvescens TaxID=46160 RepID=A0ABP6D2H1_9ACTN
MRRSMTIAAITAAGLAAAFSAVPPSAQGAEAAQAAPPALTAQAGAAATSDRDERAKLAAALEKRLGARTAGSYLDKGTGKLVVTVTDGSAAQSVRAAGATPRTVTRSRTDLEKATASLERSARISGTAWGVDPATNQVVISVDETVKGAKLAKVKAAAGKLGGAARVVSANGKLSTLANPIMLDGTAIYTALTRCSLGFNAFPVGQAGKDGPHYFLTAGHCTQSGLPWFADKNTSSFLGNTKASTFGPAGDYGMVGYEADGIHVFGTVAGSMEKIEGYDLAYVGQSVERSGSTTGVRSGRVTALNVTANYDQATVHGLIQTNACAEPGDSGGPLYSDGMGLGLTSGGSGNCSSGGTTYYQPVAPVMEKHGLEMWDCAVNEPHPCP